jgi:hypothetical protein
MRFYGVEIRYKTRGSVGVKLEVVVLCNHVMSTVTVNLLIIVVHMAYRSTSNTSAPFALLYHISLLLSRL